jgi:hypothetical protein
MAKRARGSSRPGQRRPVNRRPASSSAAPAPVPSSASTSSASAASKSSGLSEAELARASELEAQLLAEEKAAEQSRKRGRDRSSSRDMIGTGTIALRAEEEYAYVGRDLKRITGIVLIEFVILGLLYVIIDVTKVVTIGA